MSSTMEGKNVTLVSADKVTFEVAEAVAMEMVAVKHTLEDTHDRVVPINNVHSGALSRIINYCEKQVDFKARLASESEMKKHEEEFMEGVKDEEAKELILAADYLPAKGLLEVLLQGVADRMEKKSVEYVRAFFGQVNDHTPEEEAKLREKNSWAFQGADPDD